MHPSPQPLCSAPSKTGAASVAAPASNDAGRASYSVTWTEAGVERVVLFSTFKGACAHSLFQTQRGNLPVLG